MDKQNTNQNIAQHGTLRFSYDIKEGDDFYARFLMQMSQIRDCAYSREQRLSYDKSYHPVFQNLLEAKFAKEHCEAQAKTISEKVKTFDVYNESTGDVECKVTLVDKNSILNAYPLDNIK